MNQFKLLLLNILIFNTVFAVDIIKVGAYDFPPFAKWDSREISGLSTTFVKYLNEKQTKYKFELVQTSSKRRYEDFELKKFDMILFENINWGWEKFDIEASNVYMKGGEVFIALKKDRDDSYFKDLKSKQIRAIDGYHYAFLNYSTEESARVGYKIEFTNSHEGNIQSVIDERADLAIVTLEYANQFFAKRPELKKLIMFSKKLDQEYKHTILNRKNGKISMKEINLLLAKFKKEKIFQKIINE